MRSASEPAAQVAVEGLTIAYGERVLMRGIDFTVARGDVFAIMGGSGSGKTTSLLAAPPDPKIRAFLTRGAPRAAAAR